METTGMREKLHQYIDLGDEKLLKIMYVVAKEYNNENDENSEYIFSSADLQQLEDRKKKRLNGESKTYDWEQAKKIITGKINEE